VPQPRPVREDEGVTATPLYDGLLAERLAPLRAVAALHTGVPGERCSGCDLTAPCPTASVVAGTADLPSARAAVRRELVARAVAAAAAEAPTSAVADHPVAADVPLEEEAPPRPAPVLPSAAELFAPNPGTSRALDALLGGRR
jgi:hypothetical protein